MTLLYNNQLSDPYIDKTFLIGWNGGNADEMDGIVYLLAEMAGTVVSIQRTKSAIVEGMMPAVPILGWYRWQKLCSNLCFHVSLVSRQQKLAGTSIVSTRGEPKPLAGLGGRRGFIVGRTARGSIPAHPWRAPPRLGKLVNGELSWAKINRHLLTSTYRSAD